MNRAWTRVLVAVLVLGTFCAERSPACSCVTVHRPSNCADLKPIGPSFVGTVIDIENPPDERGGAAGQVGLSRYRFRIDENISGFEEKEVDIYSGRGGGDCSYHFTFGVSYFVAPLKGNAAWMAMYGAEPGKLIATICTATRPTASATVLLEELRARRRGGATVVGVLKTEPGPNDYNHLIPDATVELRTGNTTLSTQTDKGGVYQFYGVLAGTYQFELKLPIEFQVGADKAAILPTITITDQACYPRDIYAARTVPNSSP